jgi:hypothetical protein
MRLVEHLSCMGEIRNAYKIMVEKPKGKRSLNLGIDGKIMLEWIFRKESGKLWTVFIWLRIGTSSEIL